MVSNRKTAFNKLWTDKSLFPDLADWVQEVKGSSSEASCKFCRVSINLILQYQLEFLETCLECQGNVREFFCSTWVGTL